MKIFESNNVYNKNFIVFGHRGVPKLFPENTLDSFKKAIELEYDGIELDVVVTNDNILIVHHDLDLEINSQKVPIVDLKYQDILNKTSKKILKLEEVLSSIGHQTNINIEIKDQGKRHAETVKNTIVFLKKYNLIDNIVISSFNPQIIKYVKKIDNRFKTAWIWGNKNLFFFNHWKAVLKYFNPQAIHIKHQLLTPKIIKKIQKQNIKVLAYTVNEKPVFLDLISKKINGIFTDNPSILSEAKNQGL